MPEEIEKTSFISGTGTPDATGAPGGANLSSPPDPAAAQGVAPPPSEPEVHEVQVRGQKMQVPLEDLKAGYMMQADYTQGKQELAEQMRRLEPYVEVIDFLQSDAAAMDAVREAYMAKQGQAGPGQPTQNFPDPRYAELEDRLLANEFAMEAMRFQAQFPEANMDEVVDFGLRNGIPSLQHAYKAMMYDKVKTGEAQQFIEAQQHKQAAAVEQTAGSQPPAPRQIDVTGMSTEKRIEAGIEAFGSLTI